MNNLFSVSIQTLLQIIITVPVIYFLVILYIRLAGKRSTSQMNNFDWIVTVAMGSMVGSTIILKDISIIEGAVSIFFLIGLQFIVTKLMFYSKPLQNLFKSAPRLLFYKGEYLKNNMEKERITEAEILAAIRENGMKSVEKVYAVVLETDANLSVISNEDKDQPGFSLKDVEGLPEELKKKMEQKESK